jgi:hypothetical protein
MVGLGPFNAWAEHARRFNGLFAPSFIPQIAPPIIGVDKKDLSRNGLALDALYLLARAQSSVLLDT